MLTATGRAALGVSGLRGDVMPVEFIGMIAIREYSEIMPPAGPPSWTPTSRVAFARAHESSGFDRVLVGYFSDARTGSSWRRDVLAHTERLGVLLAHRPGFVAPTLAARKLATLDQFSGGRPGGAHHHRRQRRRQRARRRLPRQGGRYRRTDEYLDILRRTGPATSRSTTTGEYYHVRRRRLRR